MGLLLVYFCLTLGISMVCSVCEAMMFSATPAFVRSASKLSKAGKILKHLKINIDNSIGAIVVINTIANTVGAASVGAQFVAVFGDKFQGVVAAIMTLSVLYLGEIVPKTLGAMYWKRLILPTSYFLIVLYYIAYPFVYISRITTFFFRKNEVQKMSKDEILALMELAQKGGTIDELEMEILEHLMAQSNLKARDIMTKKSAIFALDENENIKQALQKIQDHKYSRIPLINPNTNKINSLVFRQSILAANLTDESLDELNPHTQNFNLNQTPSLTNNEILSIVNPLENSQNINDKSTLKSIAKNMRFVRDNMQVMALLKFFVICREHLVGVIDENKQLLGIVSLEDTINAVFGVGNLQNGERK